MDEIVSGESSSNPSRKDGAANLSHTFKYLVATQFLSRGIPFIFNSWIVRHLSQEEYAMYAVQIHLFVTCILFLSREGFRRACMRADIRCDDALTTRENVAKLVKVAWITFPLGLIVTLAACAYMFWLNGLSYSSPYGQAILIHGLVVIAFGPGYSYSVIRILYGRKWSDGETSTALQFYCLYVMVLAMNGTSEAFLHAVATEKEVKKSNNYCLCSP